MFYLSVLGVIFRYSLHFMSKFLPLHCMLYFHLSLSKEIGGQLYFLFLRARKCCPWIFEGCSEGPLKEI